jgi:hypothetical protein
MAQPVRAASGKAGPVAGPAMIARTASGDSCRYGARTVMNTAGDPHRARPPVSQAASASPTGTGSGSRSSRAPLPRIITSPARQSMSPSCTAAASAPRSPSRASTVKIA